MPPNVGATLLLPTRAPDRVLEGGRPLALAAGVRVLDKEPGGLRVELVSGRYAFRCAEPVLAGGG